MTGNDETVQILRPLSVIYVVYLRLAKSRSAKRPKWDDKIVKGKARIVRHNGQCARLESSLKFRGGGYSAPFCTPKVTTQKDGKRVRCDEKRQKGAKRIWFADVCGLTRYA